MNDKYLVFRCFNNTVTPISVENTLSYAEQICDEQAKEYIYNEIGRNNYEDTLTDNKYIKDCPAGFVLKRALSKKSETIEENNIKPSNIVNNKQINEDSGENSSEDSNEDSNENTDVTEEEIVIDMPENTTTLTQDPSNIVIYDNNSYQVNLFYNTRKEITGWFSTEYEMMPEFMGYFGVTLIQVPRGIVPAPPVPISRKEMISSPSEGVKWDEVIKEFKEKMRKFE